MLAPKNGSNVSTMETQIMINLQNLPTEKEALKILQKAFDFRYLPESEVQILSNWDAFDDWMWGLKEDSFVVRETGAKKLILIIEGSKSFQADFPWEYGFLVETLESTKLRYEKELDDFIFDYILS